MTLIELGGQRSQFPVLRGSLGREYRLHIGETVEDFASDWNSALWTGNVDAPYRNQLWIPTSLAEDATLLDALNNWLRRYSGWGNNNAKEIAVTSDSLTEDRARNVANAICQFPRSPLPFRVITKENQAREREYIRKELAQTYRMTGSEPGVYRRNIHGGRGIVDVPFPTPFGHEQPEGTWMVDVQIEQLVPDLAQRESFRPWMVPRAAARMANQNF